MSQCETNVRLRDSIMVRSTSSGLSTYYYYSFGLFWIIFYPFPIIKLSPFYLITSPVPTCLVHNCETSRRLFYSHLLLLLSQDQIPFDPHHRPRLFSCFLLHPLLLLFLPEPCLCLFSSFYELLLIPFIIGVRVNGVVRHYG